MINILQGSAITQAVLLIIKIRANYTVSGKKRGQSILVITLTNLDTVS